jgi:hypothetical protein
VEEERAWREKELRFLRNQVALLSAESDRYIARKALVVMLYAHFEGTCRALLSIYVNKLNLLQLKAHNVAPSLSAASLSDVFRGLRDPNKKCRVFARQLPDDSALHRFARDKEFIEVAWKFAERTVTIDVDDVVDTESNLKPIVLRKILFRLGLDPELAEPWEGTINQLLQRRNDVAHGSARVGLTEKDYAKLEQAVTLVIDDLVQAVSRAVSEQHYLTTKST